MKNKVLNKIIFSFLLCFFLIFGIWIGISVNIRMTEKEKIHKESISTVIAVVNQDMGAVNVSTKQNYSSAIIDTLGEGYILTSPQAAQAGYDKGIYGAVVTFPSTLSQQVVAINSKNPEQVTLDFLISSQMTEKNYIDTYKKIIDLQYNINQMLSYMYVYSIYTEFHSAQDKTNALFQNDADDMFALSEVQLTDFTESLNLGNVPNPGFYPDTLNFHEFVEQVRGYANNISDEYMDSYDKAKADYKVFGEHLADLAGTIKTDSDSWESDMDQWKNDILVYDTAVADYAQQLTHWGETVTDWKELIADWQGELQVFKDDADALKATVEQFQADAKEFSDMTKQWKSKATDWSSSILSSQQSRESAVVNALAKYNQNYSNMNIYYKALSDWEKELQKYSDGGAKGQAPELVLPDGYSEYKNLGELGDWDTAIFGECPIVSDDKVASVSVSIDAPAEFSDSAEIPEIPQAPEKPEVETPKQPDTYKRAILEMSTAVYDYNPDEYLTSEVRQSIYGYVSDYSEHVYDVKDQMDNNIDGNIAKLDETYGMFNSYVSDLKDSALNCHETEQQNLDNALNKFYDAKTLTSEENKLLVGTFASMMPNSRNFSVLNTDVVEFTVSPVYFYESNIRKVNQSSSQQIFQQKAAVGSIIVFSIICIIVLFALVDFIRRKNKENEN